MAEYEAKYIVKGTWKMIEAILINHFNKKLNNVMAYMEMPEKPEESFLVLQKTGSQTNDRIVTSTVAVQSYGETLLDAVKLNEDVKEIMEQLEEDDQIGGVRLVSDYNYTDPTTKRYRYQAVYNITHY